MDNLLKRTRFSNGGRESKKEIDRGKDQNIPTQKTQSFKGKRKGPNWFKKLNSRQTSRDYDSTSGIEQATAVAAAAFAIYSLKESDIADQKQKAEGPETSAINIKSKQEDKTAPIPETGRTSKRFSGSKEITEDEDKKVPITTAPLQTETKRHSSPRPRMSKSNVDIWEETEIEKIEKRYEEQNTNINTWEDKKKKKARRKLEKIESEVDCKKARAWEKFKSNMKYIDQVARGARAKAEEWKRNQTLKATEKANVIRKTGKAPTTYCCF